MLQPHRRHWRDQMVSWSRGHQQRANRLFVTNSSCSSWAWLCICVGEQRDTLKEMTRRGRSSLEFRENICVWNSSQSVCARVENHWQTRKNQNTFNSVRSLLLFHILNIKKCFSVALKIWSDCCSLFNKNVPRFPNCDNFCPSVVHLVTTRKLELYFNSFRKIINYTRSLQPEAPEPHLALLLNQSGSLVEENCNNNHF